MTRNGLLIRLAAVPVLALAIFIAGGGSSHAAEVSVDVDLSEWALDPSQHTFQAGDIVTFNVNNVGRFPHALEVSGNGIHLHSETIGRGGNTSLQVEFEFSGTYKFICPIPGHEGLGMTGEVTVGGDNPAPDGTTAAGIPLARVLPFSGTEVVGDSQDISVILHDFTLDASAIGGANADGTGHWEVFLNDVSVASVGEPSFNLTGLTPGTHAVKAALRNNDGTPLDPPVESTTNIKVFRAVESTVDLSEWALDPNQVTFQAGDAVTFNVNNVGRFPHALEVSGNGIHLHSETIGGGGNTTLEVRFEFGGTYKFICPIPGHEGLGMTGELVVEGGDPAPASDDYMGIPLLRVTPFNGTEVEGNSQDISVILHDFTLDTASIGGANVEGTGHWELSLDGTSVSSVGEQTFTLTGLEEGEHVITAALRNNDGTPLDPPVEAQTTIIALPPPAPEPPAEAPSVGGVRISALWLALASASGLLLIGGRYGNVPQARGVRLTS